jgi:hypothetical protein
MNTVARLSAAAIAALALAAPAQAQVMFTGYTNGCFYVGAVACSPETTPGARTDALGPLNYTNSTFSVMSTAGTAAIGEVVATPNLNNLGSFSLPVGPSAFNFVGNSFALNVFFTAPAGVSPTNTNYLAVLTGSVSDNAGGLFVDFDNTPTVFTYTGGSFTLRVNDVSLTNTGASVNAVPVTGFVTLTSTTVPEPSTYALMSAGLAGLFFAAKRRRRA